MSDTSKVELVFNFFGHFLQCVFSLRGGCFLPKPLHGRGCAQSTNVLALVMLFCLQLLLKRGATTRSFQNP